MSMLTAAKAKATNGSVAEAFKNEDGAIDLASIMVGIIVIGLIAGVIAATVFAVIPWAQDNAAKQQLEGVVQAQNAYTGLSANNTYGTATNLSDEGLFEAPDGVTIAVAPGTAGDGGAYAAVSDSATGNAFYVTSVNTKASDAVADVAAAQTAAAAAVTAADATAVLGAWA